MADHDWVDGSVSQDLPSRRLARLYGVNHFVASQTNPLVTWAVKHAENFRAGGPVGRTLADYAESLLRANLKLLQPLANRVTGQFPLLQSANHMFFAMADQEYTADITILPARDVVHPLSALSPIHRSVAIELAEHGREQTLPLLDLIDNCTLLSRTLKDILASFRDSTC